MNTDYYSRVRPLVGDRFFRSRVGIWDLGFGYLAAEALGRTGIVEQTWLDDGEASGALCRSLGSHHAAEPRARALLDHLAAQGPAGADWRIRAAAPDLRELAADGAPDLLLARGDDRAGAVARAAVDRGVPFVMTFVPGAAPVGCVHVVWVPGSAADPSEVIRACEDLGAAGQRDLDDPRNHVDGLEARSMSLALGKWILLRGRAARPDLEERVLERGRFLVARGTPLWPWAVRFARPGSSVLSRIQGGAGLYRPPLSLVGGRRLLCLGLGTASLFCAEAGLFFDHMVFVDCKEVSPFNPVRQVYGRGHVGRPKPEALCEILMRRLDPDAVWDHAQEGPISLWRTSRRSLGAVNLRITEADPSSVAVLREVLSRFEPTTIVVGLGRSKDDNFTVTAEARRRGIPHVTPTAFPGVTHFKHIVTDGARGPCYDCIQGHLPVDGGAGPTLPAEEREMFYGGTQPATLAETYPSAHSLLRLVQDLSLPAPARPAYLLRELVEERTCFVGANLVELTDAGWLYGLDQPFSMVTFGVADLVGPASRRRCSCGRLNLAGASAPASA